MSRFCAVTLALVLAAFEAAPAQTSDFDVALFRTRRDAELTVVDGVVQFSPRIVVGGEDCAYRVSIDVKDASKTTIYSDDWRGVLACDEAEAEPRNREVRVVETFQLAVLPGRYSLDVSLEPAGKAEAARKVTLALESLPVSTMVSDLILGRDVGIVDTVDMGNWTVRKGSVGIAADPFVVADANRSTLAYYLEVYQGPEQTLTGDVECVIRRPNGEEVIRGKVAELVGSGQSRPISGELSLAGLPPGEYALGIELKLPDTLVTSTRGFRMAAMFDTPVAARVSGARGRLQSYFNNLSDEELVNGFDGIVVWLSSQDQKTYEALPPEGKRRFLVSYFELVAPQMVGGDKPALEVFTERVRFVRDNFGERAGRSEQSGWRTDRGRIHLLHGPPTQRRQRAFPRDDSAPYEIWFYNNRGYVYLFVDETRFGNYRLIFSTDPRETSLPQWQRRAGFEAQEELQRLYGINPN